MNSSNSVDINGQTIRLIRERKGLTQLYLATVVGVTTDTISRWENRRYPSIKLENARKLAEALEVSLEELLEAGGGGPAIDLQQEGRCTVDDVPSVSVIPSRKPAPFWSVPKQLIALVASLAVVGGLVALLSVNRSAVSAVRIMPDHTAPNQPFPVLIQVTGDFDAQQTLLIREELQGEGEATGTSTEGQPKQFGKQPRWIGKLNNGQAAFVYLVEPGKKLRLGDAIRVSGDLIAREGQTTGDAVGGVNRIVLTPYHWADSDQDYVISDSEIRRAYDTFSTPGENLINFIAIEELWMAGRYTWNKKTQSFSPASVTAGKEQHP